MWDDSASRAYYDAELKARIARPLRKERKERIDSFVDMCRTRGVSSVIEVGAGAGRDGVCLRDAGLAYTGVDISQVGVDLCHTRGLNALVATATDLPFGDHTFGAGWSMSMLMHLPGDTIVPALEEMRRVVRPGGVLGIGLWGSTTSSTRIDEHGRLFQQRTDEEVETLFNAMGHVLAFETWRWHDDGGHYQWVAIELG